MSDLDRAVDARIDAYRPEHVPPFEAIEKRRARRTRVRAVGAAALSVVAVGGVAFGASALGGGPDRLPAYAGPAGGPQDVSRASFQPLTQEDGSVLLPAGRAEGVLGGDPRTGCLWLSDVVGREGRVPLIVLDDTAAADFTRSPFVIRDDGQVTVSEGNTVVLTGGYAPDGFDGSVPSCPATGTAFTGAFSSDRGEDLSPSTHAACLDLPESLRTGCRGGIARSNGDGHGGDGEMPWAPALWEPAPFDDRSRLPSCGTIERGHGLLPQESAECLQNAIGTASGAELAVSHLTLEGDPVLVYTRALPGNQSVEVFEDHTRDDLSSKTWSRSLCSGFDITSGRATGCTLTDTWPGSSRTD